MKRIAIILIALVIPSAILFFTSESFARRYSMTEVQAEDSLSKIVLEGSGYSVMVPKGFYLCRIPYDGYVAAPGDKSMMYYFFPVTPDTGCGTRLSIVFDNAPLPRTGYPRGSEFHITHSVLTKPVSFLDHSTCMHPYRSRSASVLQSPGNWIKIVMRAGNDATMQQFVSIVESMQADK